jgi:SpoIID/LytB domain protein
VLGQIFQQLFVRAQQFQQSRIMMDYFITQLVVPGTVFESHEGIVLTNGRGFGHGVGMCQYGTQFLASHGKTAEEILRYYYPGVRLVRAW